MKDEVGIAVPKNTQTRFVHPLYIPTLAFWVALHTHNIIIYGAHAGKSIPYTHGSISNYGNTLHTESEVYDINYREKQA